MATGNPIIDSQTDETKKVMEQFQKNLLGNPITPEDKEHVDELQETIDKPLPPLEESHIISKATRIITREAEAYPEHIFLTMASLIGFVTQRNVYMNAKPKKTYPNLIIENVAISGGNKSITNDYLIDLFFNWHLQLDRNLITRGATTPEKVIRNLSVQRLRIFYYDEMAEFYSMINKSYGSGITSLIIKLYNCAKEVNLDFVSAGNVIAEDPWVCFVGGTQPSTLARYLTEDNIDDGYWLRVIDVYPKRTIPLKPISELSNTLDQDLQELQTWLYELRDLFDYYRTTGLEVRLSDGAKIVLDTWRESKYTQTPQDTNYERNISLYKKMEVNIRKMAMILLFGKAEFLVYLRERKDEEQNIQGHLHTDVLDRITDINEGRFLIISEELMKLTIQYFDDIFIPQKIQLRNDILSNIKTNNNNLVLNIIEQYKVISKTKLMTEVRIKSKKAIDKEELGKILSYLQEENKIDEFIERRELEGSTPEKPLFSQKGTHYYKFISRE